MKLYAIHAPLAALSAPEKIRAASTGFSGAGLVFGPWWLLARGLWVAFFAYALAVAAVVVAVKFGALSPLAAFALLALGHLYVACEGRALRVAALARAGRPVADVIYAHSALEAEKIFLERTLAKPTPAWRGGPPAASDIIGLFPEPGR
jgi:hypothetical protein